MLDKSNEDHREDVYGILTIGCEFEAGVIDREGAIDLALVRINGLLKKEQDLPDGFKIYKCTNCQEVNVKQDNRKIRVGFCDGCDHPLWNDAPTGE